MNLLLITGGSSGLGYALIKSALNADYDVINISRTKPEIKNQNLKHFKIDLTKTSSFEKNLKFLSAVNFEKYKSILIINNAGMIQPIGLFEQIDLLQLKENIDLNLVAPLILTRKVFDQIKSTQNTKVNFVNIISGASFKPILGWSAYCTSKAGLAMFSQCFNEELKTYKNIQCVAVSPGIIDTPMQEKIRSTQAKNFPDVKKFKQYKKKNQLRSAEAVSESLLTFFTKIKLKESFYTIDQIESLNEKNK